jgi:hypothetical protein
MPPSCSFCGSTEHNIRRCNSRMVPIIYNNILRIYREVVARGGGCVLFTRTIHQQFNLRDLKVVGVRYFGLRSAELKNSYAILIWNRFCRLHPATPIVGEWLQPREQPFWTIDRQGGDPALLEVANNMLQLQGITGADYVPAEDEYIPINLNQQFEAAAEQSIQKFHINTLLYCQESDEELDTETECPICYDPVKLQDSVTLNCNHQYCYTCVSSICQNHKNPYANPGCALCREPMSMFYVKTDDMFDQLLKHCYL